MNTTDIQRRLRVSFSDEGLLRQALTHPSYLNENPQAAGSNQRMEFLGDALLDMVVALELYRRHPGLDEGGLTDLRSKVVKGQTLAAVARRIGLGPYLALGQGEAATGGQDRDSNLAAALEALVGAVLLDKGYTAAQRFALRLLEPEITKIGAPPEAKDPKSVLQELTQRQGRGAPAYAVVRVDGPPHARVFTVEVLVQNEPTGRGESTRKADAQRRAAREALKRLSG